MRTLRFYCETLDGDRAVLDSIQSHHLSHVLRLEAGQGVEVFDGKGLLADAQVEQVGRKQVILRLVKKTVVPSKTSGRVILAVSIAKGERFDWMIEKCTELGVDHIAAVQCERTVKMGKISAIERYTKIALAAAKQCGRVYLPTLSGPDTLKRTLDSLRAGYPEAGLLYGDAEGASLDSVWGSAEGKDKIVFIGPEGGFTDSERELLAGSNVRPVSANSNILRIETAAMAFAAFLCRNSQS
jgi:16S rRNA (uracil1498-N3)-methyltransferase